MEITNDPQKIGAALHWIVSLLNRHNIPYQIVGGLAAKAYGSTRPLVDIDIYAPMEQLRPALDEMRPYIVREPLPHHSESWKLIYMALEYHDIYIEIGNTSTNPRFYNRRDGCWEAQTINFANSTIMTLYDTQVAVMPRDELLAYKAMLQREVDYQDINEIND
ncbi:MAG TPA: hypothetical protein VKV40_07795 [Ktedonobacteraceae bacterium]|nr:hypothetical protein [Ktedonobacteraceae bacterium]